jgi:hypothetical protein
VLTISRTQFKRLGDGTWKTWVHQHMETLADLLPDIAASYSEPAWSQRIEALLRRADLHDMLYEAETVAYCYGSLTLGIGFESRPDLSWAPDAMALRGDTRAEALWDGFEAAAEAAAPDLRGTL